ncbi:MAG: flagellar basal body rod protein FlgB [Lachnospiraceae bacterium]|nr:flagellar basal body rod protein FlgB [Lachnospiraceae bacterium]
MIHSNLFDYVNVLDKAADAAWMRNEAINNNLANAATPNYKRQDVSFETEFRNALMSTGHSTMDGKVANVNMKLMTPRVYTDTAEVSYRLDGNNVDVDTENVALAKNQLKYEGLLNSITQEFNNLKAVSKSV